MNGNHTLYKRMLLPLKIKTQVLKNRIYFPPFGIDAAYSDGCFSEALASFYQGILSGGYGLVIIGNASITSDSTLGKNGLQLCNQVHCEALSQFLFEHRNAQNLIGIQLQHYGGQGVTMSALKPLLTPSGIMNPSSKQRDRHYNVRPMTVDDIHDVRQQFVNSAILARSAGFKYIQIQSANGYLLSSFLSPLSNHRTDQYGGTPVRRAQFLAEILKDIRSAVGNEVLLSARLGINDFIGRSGILPEDFQEIIPLLEEAGADLFTFSVGNMETFAALIKKEMEYKNGFHQSIKTVKAWCRVPTGFSGFVTSVDEAEKLIEDGVADLVGMGRAIFSDNQILNKSLNHQQNTIQQCRKDGYCFRDKLNPASSRVYCCVNPNYLRPQSLQEAYEKI